MTNVRWFRYVFLVVLALGIVLAGAPAQAQTEPTAETEPNDTCFSAQELGAAALPITINGSLDTPPDSPDVDYYRITGTPGQRVVIDQRGSASGGGTLEDPSLGIYGSDCALINYVHYGLDALIEFQVPVDGVFVLAASSGYDWDFTGQGSGSGTYTLSVQKQPIGKAISGQLVDAKTGAPLTGMSNVRLQRCTNGLCWTTVGELYPRDGSFRFESGNGLYPWETVLRAGEYQLTIYPPYGYYLNLETPIFTLADGQDLNLGNLKVSPVPLVGSIRGRAVDAVTGDPLAGDALPFAEVELQSCSTEWGLYCYTVARQDADAAGGFNFRQGVSGPLEGGTYRVRISADQYFATESEPFEVADEQHYDAGDLAVKSYPVRLALAQGCAAIPATGGTCDLSVQVTNGGTAELKADTWTLVRAIGFYSVGELTTFPLGTTKTVNLAPGASATLAYSFTAPASLQNGATVCARTYASDKKNTFAAIGIHDVLCLTKGADGFTVLTDKQKREALKQERRD
jgi:hypothetical protein